MEKCCFKDVNGNPITIKPNGHDELDPCDYVEVARLKNVTISILQCRKCGHMEIAWERQDNTVEEEYEDEK